RKPALSFIRPFGCLVTILNTIDHLGKYDGKAGEGFFVGYSTNSKAFRVFNIRTRIVEENLHVQFSETTLNTAGSGPNWLFDIDALTKSMNYKPVVAGNQSNGNASTKACDDAGEEEKKDTKDLENKDSEVSSTKEPRVNQKKDANINSTNNINIVSPTINAVGIEDNVVHENIVYGCADDSNMPNLEEIVYSDDDEEADMNNLNTSMPVSPIPTTILHKDHPLEQIIRDIHSAPQTKRMTESEPKKVWTLVDLPYGKRAIGTKSVYRNKKDKRVAIIEAIRLFLAYASYKDFVVYQMDVKCAFLYGKIKEEVYVCQPQRGQIDKTLFIKRVKGDIILVQVYVDDIIFGSTKKVLCTDFEKLIHKKFQMSLIASTPMETSKPLIKDESAEDVDVHLYRSMIGSLMYLTSSRPDIMFVVCQPKLGLWYPKDSPFDLETYTDSDYAGAILDRKSTTGGCQFLRSRLISRQCKKQIVVANSISEAEYVVVSNCCGQVLWIQNQLLDYGYNFMNTKIFIDNESTICIVKNLVFHSKTKHIEIRHHFIRDSNEKKLIQMIKIHTNQNVANLLTKAFDVGKFQYLIARWLKCNATTAKDGIEVKTGNSKVNADGHYLVLLGITWYCWAKVSTARQKLVLPGYLLLLDETVHEERKDGIERAATTVISLDAEQGSGNIIMTC
ncbi:putative ribonuclease H-like domain-containing protein, partial [Tanacetum coccineum]